MGAIGGALAVLSAMPSAAPAQTQETPGVTFVSPDAAL